MYFDEKITHWVQISSPHVGSFQNEALEKENRSTKHSNLENEAP